LNKKEEFPPRLPANFVPRQSPFTTQNSRGNRQQVKAHNIRINSLPELFKGYLPYFISGENGSGAEHVITDFAQFVEFLRNSKQVN
jgi:hypothetical protein